MRCKQVALSTLMSGDVGFHELTQNIGRLLVLCLARGREGGTQLLFDSNTDAGVLHGGEFTAWIHGVYPRLPEVADVAVARWPPVLRARQLQRPPARPGDVAGGSPRS